ncbi:nuclease PIN [Paenibacillus lemnae]|uniref:Nuclease PIN n=2 Tax=Paenibacillus lemnae TaxID=1330551 RepID=A0A848M311_PAELE|nr:nuclease PIN [Paenibacillus lemnae]
MWNLKRFKLLLAVLMLTVPVLTHTADADVMYNTFTRDGFGRLVWGTQPAYAPAKIIGHDLYVSDEQNPEVMQPSPLRNPQDVYIDNKDEIYVADSGNNRIVHFHKNGSFKRYITPEDSPLNNPHSVFVTEDGNIYVADTGNKRVIVMDPDGKLLQEFGKPDSEFMPKDLVFDPIKVIVDKRGYIYIATLGGYYGAIQLDPEGNFSKFYGANKAPFSAIDAVKRALYTRDMYANELNKVPPAINNMTIDDNGFIYTVTSGKDVTSEQIKKLNFEGQNLLAKSSDLSSVNNSYGEFTPQNLRRQPEAVPSIADAAVDSEGNFTVIDKTFNNVSQYDANGELLFFWGGQSANGITQLGLIKSPVSIDMNSQQELFILDNQENVLQQFRLSEFGALVYHANGLTMAGKYEESEQYWSEVLKLNAFYTPALSGLAKAAYKKGDYNQAAVYYRQAGNEIGYSESFWQIRLQWMQKNFAVFATGLLVLIFGSMVVRRLWSRLLSKRSGSKAVSPRSRAEAWLQHVRHVFYLLKHPIDGFTALRFEGKGSYIGAFIILLGAYAAISLSKLYTSFSFNKILIQQVNIYMIFLQFVIFVLAWVICNYLISAIYRGEGRFRDVFIGCAYALVPLIIVGIPLALISNVLTLSEAPLYYYIRNAMLVWIGFLFFWKVQSLHNYSVGETLVNILLTIFAIAVMAVLAFILVGLTNEIRVFLYELYQEVMLR